MRDEWFQLEAERQVHETVDPIRDAGWGSPASVGRADPVLLATLALAAVVAVVIVLANQLFA